MSERLPEQLENRLAVLSLRGAKGAKLANILRQRYDAASSEAARHQVELAIETVTQPSKFPWWVISVAALPLAGLGLFLLLNYRHAELVASGEQAVAKVLRLEEGFCWFGTKNSDCVALTLSVQPARGEAFTTRIDHDIAERYLPKVQAGSLIYVSLDTSDRGQVYLDERASALPAPQALRAHAIGK